MSSAASKRPAPKPEDAREAARIKDLADHGDAEAQVQYGRLLELGKGVKQDLVEAGRYYEMSASQENPHGCVAYGWYLESGVVKKWNLEERARAYKLAADAGDARSQYHYGVFLEEGYGVRKDHAEAARYYKMSADQGDPYGQFKYGVCLEFDRGVPWHETNDERAFELYMKSAEQGYALGQNNCGLCYQDGKGVEVNIHKAVEFFKKGAEQGYKRSLNNLGLCYQDGRGVKKDLVEAARLFQKSAQQGHAPGCINYSNCLSQGRGIKANPKEAERYDFMAQWVYSGNKDVDQILAQRGWHIDHSLGKSIGLFKKAADAGDDMGSYHYGRCLIQGVGCDRNFEEGVRRLRDASLKGITEAQVTLAQLLISGQEEIPANPEEAVSWFKAAADKGDPNGMFEYGMCLRRGTGVVQNPEEGLKWILKAGEGGSGDGQLWRACSLLEGRDEKRNPTLAVHILEELLAKPNPHWNAHLLYGYCLQEGLGIEPDAKGAREHFKQSGPWEKLAMGIWREVMDSAGDGSGQNFSTLRWERDVLKRALDPRVVVPQAMIDDVMCVYGRFAMRSGSNDTEPFFREWAAKGNFEARRRLRRFLQKKDSGDSQKSGVSYGGYRGDYDYYSDYDMTGSVDTDSYG